jgi:hypothetical protein
MVSVTNTRLKMTILIDPEKSQLDALEAQARATRALAHEHKRANDLRELEIILSTMTREEQKEYLAKKEKDKNEAIVLLFKIVGVIILVIVIYSWLR